MGVAGMILGTLAIILVWIPLIGLIAIPMIAVGLPLSIAGYRNARRHNTGVGTARAGIATNTVAILIGALVIVALVVSPPQFGP